MLPKINIFNRLLVHRDEVDYIVIVVGCAVIYIYFFFKYILIFFKAFVVHFCTSSEAYYNILSFLHLDHGRHGYEYLPESLKYCKKELAISTDSIVWQEDKP